MLFCGGIGCCASAQQGGRHATHHDQCHPSPTDEGNVIAKQQQAVQRGFVANRRCILRNNSAQQADVRQIEAHRVKTGQCQRSERQFLDLGVRFEAGVAVDFGADLQRFADAATQAVRVQQVD